MVGPISMVTTYHSAPGGSANLRRQRRHGIAKGSMLSALRSTSAANAPRAASHIFSLVPPQDVHTALKLSACPLISLCGVYLEVQACEVHLWLSTALHGPIPYGEFPGFLGGSVVKNLPTNAGETQAWSPVQEDPTCLGASKHHHC